MSRLLAERAKYNTTQDLAAALNEAKQSDIKLEREKPRTPAEEPLFAVGAITAAYGHALDTLKTLGKGDKAVRR